MLDMMSRTRTIEWQDPMIGASQAPSMPGIEYLRAIVRGELPPPPIAVLMDLRIAEVEEGRVVFTVQPAEFHYNPIGMVHGGLACTIMDSAMGCAVHSMLPAGVGYSTTDIQVRYLRPLTRETGVVRCEAEIIHVGQRSGTAHARIVDEKGKLYAHGTTTCMIFR